MTFDLDLYLQGHLDWLRKSCPLCSVSSSGWILFIFGTNDHYHLRVCCVLYFFQNLKIWKFLANLNKKLALILKKTTVLNGFFLYLAQMITSMRGCVAYDDLKPWPISSRSFGLGLENRVRSVASTVLDGLFPYLIQIITSMRRCVACDDLGPWPISSWSFDLDSENRVRSVAFSVLNRLFPYLPQITTTIRGCVMGQRGVSSERRRSSCSSFKLLWPMVCLMITCCFT